MTDSLDGLNVQRNYPGSGRNRRDRRNLPSPRGGKLAIGLHEKIGRVASVMNVGYGPSRTMSPQHAATDPSISADGGETSKWNRPIGEKVGIAIRSQQQRPQQSTIRKFFPVISQLLRR